MRRRDRRDGVQGPAHLSERRGSFVEQVLDGHARIDQLDVADAAASGLDPAERALVEETPDALRPLLHARRFGIRVPLESIRDQAHVRTWSTLVASATIDPFDLAELEAWQAQVDAAAARQDERAHA